MRAAGCHEATFSSPSEALLGLLGLRSSRSSARVARPTPTFDPARSAAATPHAEAIAAFYTVVGALLVPYTGGPARSSLALHGQRGHSKADAPSPMTQRFRYPDSRMLSRGESRQRIRDASNRGACGAFGEGSSFFNLSNHLSVRDARADDRVRGSTVQTQPQPAEGSVS